MNYNELHLQLPNQYQKYLTYHQLAYFLVFQPWLQNNDNCLDRLN